MPKRSQEAAVAAPDALYRANKKACTQTSKSALKRDRVSKEEPTTNACPQTERSHEENQERAYIAASRRADRSIEARVQSARMASSIHKKRTGRGFKVTEEIVMKEEMYEEEEDEFPRQFRALTAHLQTGSPDMNNRLNAYVSNHFALASLVHQQEVDRMFAEQFPNASQVSQQLSSSMYYQPPMGPAHGNSASPQFPLESSQPGSPTQFHKNRSQSMVLPPSRPGLSLRQTLGHKRDAAAAAAAYRTRHASLDDAMSTPAMSPGSGASTDPSSSNATPIFTMAPNFPVTEAPLDPLIAGLDQASATSPFTSELPAETKMLSVFDPEDPLAAVFYGDPSEMMASGACDYANPGADFAAESQPLAPKTEAQDHFYMAQPAASYLNPPTVSRIGTPGGGQGDSWESWVQYD